MTYVTNELNLHNSLNDSLVMSVRLLNMNIFLGWADSYGNIQLNSAAAFHDEFTPVRAVTRQWRISEIIFYQYSLLTTII